jgi:hypothetical protein
MLNKKYNYDYSTELKNKTNYKNIERLHKSLTEDNYLTHAIILANDKELNKEQIEYHQERMKFLFESNATFGESSKDKVF